MLGVSLASEKFDQKPLVTENLVRYIRRFPAGLEAAIDAVKIEA